MRIVAVTERSDRKIVKEYMYHSYQKSRDLSREREQGEKWKEEGN